MSTLLVLLACGTSSSGQSAELGEPVSAGPAEAAEPPYGEAVLFTVNKAPLELRSARIAPVSESRLRASRPQGDFLVVSFRNVSEHQLTGIGITARFEDAAGAELLVERGNRDADHGYLFHVSGGPARCGPGEVCEVSFEGWDVPKAFDRLLVAPQSADLAGGDTPYWSRGSGGFAGLEEASI